MVGVMEKFEMKPVPIPRNRRVIQDTTNNNQEESPPKPVPLPRKILQKTPDKLLPELERIPVSDEAKRSTVNIFKRGRSIDPFEGFEKELPSHASQLLSAVTFTSPLHELRLSSISSSSSSTNQSDSSDYYDQPQPIRAKQITTSTDGVESKEQMGSHSSVFQPRIVKAHDSTSTIYSEPGGGSIGSEEFTFQQPILNFQGKPQPIGVRDSDFVNSLYSKPIKNPEQRIQEPIRSQSCTNLPRNQSGTNSPIRNQSDTSFPIRNLEISVPSQRIRSQDSIPKKPERRYYSNVSISPKLQRAFEDSTYEPLFPIKPKRTSISNGNVSPASSNSSLRSTPEPQLQPTYARVRDDLCVSSNSSNSTTRTTSLPSLEENSLSLKRTGSNRSSEGSNVSASSSHKKTSSSHYDDVAVEDGTVVFLDNQLNTKRKEEKIPRDSVVMEFDPLFKPSQSEASKFQSDTYEFVETEAESVNSRKGGSTEEPGSNFYTLNPGVENLTYNSTVTQPPPLPPELATEDHRDSDGEATYEDADESEEKKGEDQMPISVTLSNLKRSDTNNGSFLRRLSNRIRLIPIREETPRGSVESLNTKCGKCYSEHGESSKCRFVPVARSNVVYSSYLYRPGGIVQKEFSKKWAVLAKGKLTFYNDKSVVLEEIPLESGVLISKKPEVRTGPGGIHLHCFEISSGGKKKENLNLAGTNEGDRNTWMQKWIEAFTSVFPTHVLNGFDRGGWGFMKESVTSDWHPSWFILKERTLFYAFVAGEEFYELDLRKARSVTLSTKDVEQKCGLVENTEVLTVDMITKILFIQTESSKVTGGWERVISTAAKQNGVEFHEMQLTLDDVPVIVDKCIDFLYAHGTLAEGIYRQSGSNTRITFLLSEFQKDSWTVSISHKEFSAHDVAGTLKRFFRTLPQPLFTTQLYEEWIASSKISDEGVQNRTYERLLDSLPPINYNILKKLICHLYAVHELHEKNLMPLNNLAPIWGPTLMNVESPVKLGCNSGASESDEQYRSACAESEVVKDLIRNYYALFRVDSTSRERERKMQDALENFHLGATKRKCSGDMKMWIYIWEKDETNPINITLTPQGTAHSIVHQLCRKAQLRNSDNLSLHEVICGKSLERPLHPSEIVIETVLRWSIWDIQERKDNYLILKKNTLYPALIPYAKDPMAVYGEFKFADSKSKSLKKYAFKFGGAMLKYYKDSKANVELGSWKIEDIVWYMGSEPKRTPAPRWAFTFVKRNYPFKRSRDEPFFGNVVSTGSEEELHKWIAAMVVGEHPSGLYPSVIV